MDRAKAFAKGVRHSSGDRPIHRDTWKSDIKDMATGKKKDSFAYARDHNSAPLNSLKDPDSFGPPPRNVNYPAPDRTARTPAASSPAAATLPARTRGPPPPPGGLGSAVPAPSRRREEEEQEAAEKAKPPPEPYRKDTTGLRTDHLPKPPIRRAENIDDGSGQSPSLPPRHYNDPTPSLPPRHQAPPQQALPPSLPPRMNEHPDEYTPPPPPTYSEATDRSNNPALINAGAASRLTQAGISVPGLDIGQISQQSSSPSPINTGHPSQLSELQQRFARTNPSSAGEHDSTSGAPATLATSSIVAAAAHKKPPPPPPHKKPSLGANRGDDERYNPIDSGAPPPLPISSKPRP